MKQYFYSCNIIKDGVKVSFGHGFIQIDDDSKDIYEEVKKQIRGCCTEKGEIQMIAFNRIN